MNQELNTNIYDDENKWADHFVPKDALFTSKPATHQPYISKGPCTERPWKGTEHWYNYYYFKKGFYSLSLSSSGYSRLEIFSVSYAGSQEGLILVSNNGTVDEKTFQIQEEGWYFVHISNSNVGVGCPPICYLSIYLNGQPFNLVKLTPIEDEEKIVDRTNPDPCNPKQTASSNEKLASVEFDMVFGTSAQYSGMQVGYVSILSQHITAALLTPKTLLFRHISQRRIISIENNILKIRWETGETIQYELQQGESVAMRYGTSKTRTSLLQKLDNLGEPTINEAFFYQEIMNDGSSVRYSAKSLLPVLFVTNQQVEVTIDELTNELEVLYENDSLKQVYSTVDGLLDIQVVGETSYSINWYTPKNVLRKEEGMYKYKGLPEKTWIISGNISNVQGNIMQLEELLHGNRTAITTWIENGNEWIMTKGEGSETQISRLVVRSIPVNKWERTFTTESLDGTVLSFVQEITALKEYGSVLLLRTEGREDSSPLTTFFEYNNEGRITKKTFPDGSTIRYEYDKIGREILQAYDWEEGGEVVINTSYINLRVNDNRPEYIKKIIVKKSGDEVVIKQNNFIYEEFDDFSRITNVTSALGLQSEHTEITEYYNNSAIFPSSRGQIKFTQYIDGTQSYYLYSNATGYGAIYQRIRETRVNSELLPGWSERFVDYIDVQGNKVCLEHFVLTSSNTWVLSNREVFTYNESHQWISREKANGRVTDRSMSCKGPLLETDEDGVVTTYSYNTAKQLIESIRAATPTTPEIITSIRYDGAGREIEVRTDTGPMTTITKKTYDTQNRILSETDEIDRITHYAYPYQSTTISVTSPTGATYITHRHPITEEITVRDGTGQNTEFYYRELVPDGIRTTVFDTVYAEGKIQQIIYKRITKNGLGEIIGEEKPTLIENCWLNTTYKYDEKGHLIYKKTGNMSPEHLLYDSAGRLVRHMITMSERPDNTNSFCADYSYGFEVQNNDVYQTMIQTRYNSYGEKIKERNFSLISELNSTIESMDIQIDIDGKTSQQWVEYGTGAERIHKQSVPSSDIVSEAILIDGFQIFQKDHQGVSSSASRTFKQDRIMLTETDARGNTYTEEYDIAGRLIKKIDATNNIENIIYETAIDKPSKVINALGEQSFYAYDHRGRMIAEWGSHTRAAVFAYNERDQLINLRIFQDTSNDIMADPRTLSNGESTSWKYDLATGLLLKKTYANGVFEEKSYNLFNQLISHQLPNGVTTFYTYTPFLGKVIQVSYSDNTPSVSAMYNHLGWITSITDAAGTYNFTYNEKGRLKQESLVKDGLTINLWENYDSLGRNTSYLLNSCTDTDKPRLLTSGMWSWDNSGRICQAGMYLDNEIRFTYIPKTHLLSGFSYQNTLSMNRSYETHRDNITEICYKNENGISIMYHSYAYDTLERIVNHTQQHGEEKARQDNFGYNHQSELVSANLGENCYTYTYDSIGNRKISQKNSEKTCYSVNQLNQYISITQDQANIFNPVFDENGNQVCIATSTGFWNVSYNAIGSPICFEKTDGSLKVENCYDYLGRRCLQKVTKNGIIIQNECYLYRGYLQIAALDMLDSGNPIRTIFWNPLEKNVTSPLILHTKNGSRYIYAMDVARNITGLLDTSGNMVKMYDYSPFGVPTESGIPEQNPLQWNSEIYDAHLGLVYYNFRYYNPIDGRWISRDPIAEAGGFNLYSFVNNAPTHLMDILGLIGTHVTVDTNKGPIELPQNGPFSDLAQRLIEKCKNPRCCVQGGYNSRKCEEKALLFAQSVQATWEYTTRNKGKKIDEKDNVNGYLCWDWTEGFKNIFENIISKGGPDLTRLALSYRVRTYDGDPNLPKPPVHYYMEICPCNCASEAKNTNKDKEQLKRESKNTSTCCLMIDDGYAIVDTYVHDPSTLHKIMTKNRWRPSTKRSEDGFTKISILELPLITIKNANM